MIDVSALRRATSQETTDDEIRDADQVLVAVAAC